MASPKDGQNSDEEDEEEIGDGDEFIDLVDALDGKGDADGDDSKNVLAQASETRSNDGGVSSEDVSESAEDGDDDEQIDFAPSDDEEAPEAIERLHDFVSNLEVATKKRKAANDDDEHSASNTTRKRRLLQEKTEAGDENEFRVQSRGILLPTITFLYLHTLRCKTYPRRSSGSTFWAFLGSSVSSEVHKSAGAVYFIKDESTVRPVTPKNTRASG